MNTDPHELVVEVHNSAGRGRVVLVCEHASHHIPEAFDGLGLNESDRKSHAAWDPGALALSFQLSDALDSVLIAGLVSRLVYDCNRPPDVPSAFPAKSELIEVPGNRDLSEAEKKARVAMVYDPFCAAVKEVLDQRPPDTVVVTVHSFTPIYFGRPRAVEIGLLHDSDSRLVDAMLENSGRVSYRVVERNSPYGPDDGVTHSLRLHALSRGLPNVMIEVRNDLLTTPDSVAQITHEILKMLRPALAQSNMGA